MRRVVRIPQACTSRRQLPFFPDVVLHGALLLHAASSGFLPPPEAFLIRRYARSLTSAPFPTSAPSVPAALRFDPFGFAVTEGKRQELEVIINKVRNRYSVVASQPSFRQPPAAAAASHRCR